MTYPVLLTSVINLHTLDMWLKPDNGIYDKPALTNFTKKKSLLNYSQLYMISADTVCYILWCEVERLWKAGGFRVCIVKTEFAATGSAVAPWSGLPLQLKQSTFTQKGLKELLSSLSFAHTFTLKLPPKSSAGNEYIH